MGSPLPEITSDILARLSDVAPELQPLPREYLLCRARFKLSWTHPRAPTEADFEGALRQRAIRLHEEDKKRGVAHLSIEDRKQVLREDRQVRLAKDNAARAAKRDRAMTAKKRAASCKGAPPERPGGE